MGSGGRLPQGHFLHVELFDALKSAPYHLWFEMPCPRVGLIGVYAQELKSAHFYPGTLSMTTDTSSGICHANMCISTSEGGGFSFAKRSALYIASTMTAGQPRHHDSAGTAFFFFLFRSIWKSVRELHLSGLALEVPR